MEDQFKESTPIYMQLMGQIRYSIVSGQRLPGARLESVRELAQEWGVNPNTVQRALSELEREGLLYSERTAGRFVTREKERIQNMREQMAADLIEAFFQSMGHIGIGKEEAVLLLEKAKAGEGGDGIWTA